MQVKFVPTPHLEAKVAGLVTVRDVIVRCCAHVEREAKRHSPVRTGNLRRSIKRSVDVDATGPVGTVAATAFYAAFVEFGTRRNRAQPFLRPALESLRTFKI